jgi:hypothetical protein
MVRERLSEWGRKQFAPYFNVTTVGIDWPG